MKRIVVAALFLLWVSTADAQSLSVTTYDIGAPTLTELYVNPSSGNDNSSGLTPGAPLRTVDEAWRRIPAGATLGTTGYRINLASGFYPESSLPNYWESRYGTRQFPIILQGGGGVVLGGDINMFDTKYFYLLDVTIAPEPAGDAFHCERCDYVLIRRVTMNGGNRAAHETVKFNQSQHVYIEDSDIHGADDNAIDFVSVQAGHIVRSRIHDAQDWCAYVKGGSAYITVEANEFYDCGTGGFTAGQGTGFEFTTAPWIHFQAYDVKFVNNIIHDIEGAAFGVNGGYNILMAHNSAYRVGSRDHAIEVVFGYSSCDGDSAACNARRLLGGWGPGAASGDADDLSVPNRNVFIYDNIIYNPPGFEGPAQVFAVYGPRFTRPGTNLPNPAFADDNLQIRGNIIRTSRIGGVELGLGGDGQGCPSENPTCNATQVLQDNSINIFEPQLMNPAAGDFRPVSGSSVFSALTFPLPAFSGIDRPSVPVSPAGNYSNAVSFDRGGAPRNFSLPVAGAYVSDLSARDPGAGMPGAPDDGIGGGGGGGGDLSAPTITKAKSPKKVKRNKKISVEAVVRDNVQVGRVYVFVAGVQAELRPSGNGSKAKYKGSLRVPNRGDYAAVVVAIDTSNNQSEAIAGFIRVR